MQGYQASRITLIFPAIASMTGTVTLFPNCR
jgi:hypothetical protein